MLVDGLGRRVEYLRLSVTDRCDLRCAYCMPAGFNDFEEPSHWLSFDEIERLVALFARLGLKRVRLTGGEPLLRRNLVTLAKRLADVPGINDLSLSTNGTRLVKHAASLRKAGVARLNVSLDSLDRARIQKITGRDVLPQILEGLGAAVAEGFQFVKINMVMTPGITDAEIDAMVAYCCDRNFVLRLIEVMPIGGANGSEEFVNLGPIRERLRTQFGLIDGVVPGGGPARYLVSSDHRLQLGFITPMSQHFCETCNRVRLGVDGTLYLCLGQDDRVDFRGLLRSGCDDSEIEDRFRTALMTKPGHHEFRNRPGHIVRAMSSTGG